MTPEKITTQPFSILYYILPPFILSILTGIAYYPSLHYDFQFDDIANITKHFEIRNQSLKQLYFSGTRWISYWLNTLHYQYGKFDPFSYRVGNIICHTLNGVLLFFILFIVLKNLKKETFFKRNSFALAIITSLLFLLHPVQTQTVSYVIQGQLEGLSAFCSLSMVLCFILASQSSNLISKILLYLSLFGLGILATGTKEIAIIIPFLLIITDWFFIAQGSTKSFISRLWVHGITTMLIIGCYIRFLKPSFFLQLFGLQMEVGNNIGNIITSKPDQMITPLNFFISQFKVILHYLWIFIWPANISVEYDWVLVKSFVSPDCILPFIALATIGYMVYKLLKRDPIHPIGFAVLWFAIAIAPRSSILPSPELLVDYKTYLASCGWLFIIAAASIAAFEQLAAWAPKLNVKIQTYKVQHLFVILLAVALGFGTQKRNLVWQSGLDFWANIIENAPGKARGYNNYGVELSQKLGKYAESIPHFKHAIGMDKQYRDPYNNLAVAYAATHQIDRAIETLKESLKINRFYPEAYNNMASFLIEKKDFEEAKRALSIAIQLRPHYGKAHFNTARIHLEEGNVELAYESFKRSCMEADLDTEAGYMGYAKASIMLKKWDEAIFACQRMLECNPQNEEGAFMLGNSYYLSDQFDNAIKVYDHIVKKNPMDGKAWHNLAESYFSKKNYNESLTCFQRALALPEKTPTLYLRMAACHEALGSPKTAQNILVQLLNQKIPEQAKGEIRASLNTLNKQYGLT